MNNLQGWLNIYKPVGISSFNVVQKIRKHFNINKIGHGGTLDPLAEGVLPIAIGKTTKLIPFINSNLKNMNLKQNGEYKLLLMMQKVKFLVDVNMFLLILK